MHLIPHGNFYPVWDLCVGAQDSIVFVGVISKDCVCGAPWIESDSEPGIWTSFEWNGKKIKIRSLGGSKFEVMDETGKPVSVDSNAVNDHYCDPVPGTS